MFAYRSKQEHLSPFLSTFTIRVKPVTIVQHAPVARGIAAHTSHYLSIANSQVMAPVDTDAATRSNSLPIAIFGGQIILVTTLTAHILITARRAAKSLPPSTRTRAQDPVRRRHALIFSGLAALSLASVTTFAVLWRALSYVRWAEHKNHDTPGTIWSGWYGTGEAERWHLGDWITDIDLLRENDSLAVMRPEGFLYTSQYIVGLLAASIFMGVEGTYEQIIRVVHQNRLCAVDHSLFGSLKYVPL